MNGAFAAAVSPPARWSSRARGTSERTWLRAIPWAALARVDIAALARRYSRLVLVAAHPDDETLAVGAFVATCVQAGLTLDVLLVTDGEGSHPAHTGLTSDVVRTVRRREFEEALSALGVQRGSVTRLALPDGGVAQHREELAEALRDLLCHEQDALGSHDADAGERHARPLVVAPSMVDGHADHDVCGSVAQCVAHDADVSCVTYPLWWWHWGDPGAIDAAAWGECALVVPGVAALKSKRAAVAVYTSQTGTFARPAAEPAMLDDGVLAHVERLVEVLFDPDGALPRVSPDAVAAGVGRTPSASFDAMFEGGNDPWGVETRWYERRRRALIEAILPDEKLGRVLDLGCSTGALTAVLAARASGVVAVDGSARALAVARRRGLDDATWLHGELPSALDEFGDEGCFDTVVLSEIGYFLDGAALLQTLAGIDRLLAPGGIVVVANWRHPTRDIPLDGRLVDEQVSRVWPTLARYEDDDVAIVVARPDARGERSQTSTHETTDDGTTGEDTAGDGMGSGVAKRAEGRAG